MEPAPPAVEVWNPNHWTVSEVSRGTLATLQVESVCPLPTFFFFFFLPFCLPKPNHGGEEFGDTPAKEAVGGGLTHSHRNKTRTAFLEGTLTVLNLKKDSAFLLFVSCYHF